MYAISGKLYGVQKRHWFGVLAVGLMSLVGCGGVATAPIAESKEMAFGQDIRLTVEYIPFSQIIKPDFLAYKQGALIVASSKSDTVLHTYATPELTYRYGAGRKGRGPNEISNLAVLCNAPDASHLYIWGFQSMTSIRKIDLSSSDSVRFVADLDLGKFEVFNQMHLIGDSLLVYFDARALKIKKYNIVHRKEVGEVAFEKEQHNESSFYSNRGQMLCTDSLIVYAYVFKKQIDIYDLHTLKLTTRISDGKSYPAPEVSMVNMPKFLQFQLFAGKDRFYVLTGTPDSPVPFANAQLEAYDYHGNPLIRYVFDTPPGLFVVDEQRNMIYGYNNRAAEGKWLRYKIHN